MNLNQQEAQEDKPDPSMILSWYLKRREDLYKQVTLAIMTGKGYSLAPLVETGERMANMLERVHMALPPPRDMLRRPAYAASCVIVVEDPELMIAYDPTT